jgi:hypothetical protein
MSRQEKEYEYWRNKGFMKTPSEATGSYLRVIGDNPGSSDLDVRSSIEVRDDASSSGPAVNNPWEEGMRKNSAFSCEICRRRKVKCDRVRPICAQCVARGEQSCVYNAVGTIFVP